MASKYLAWLCIAVMLCVAQPATAGLMNEQEWVFKVYLDDREIGFHQFKVNQEAGDERVEINASFDVKILFFNAYSYKHQNLETWKGGCLAGIESVTNDNGDKLQVSGRLRDGEFYLVTQDRSASINSDCLRSFAYWNAELLQSPQLLNSQTGEIVDVSFEESGSEIISFGSREVEATKYTLQTGEGPIQLWYTRDGGNWLALEAPARGGRTIRYEPVILPFLPSDDERWAME